MGERQEAIVRQFCAAWGDGTTPRPDIDTIVSMFSDDAVWRLWVPGGPVIRGRDALRAEIERQCTFSTFTQCGIKHVVSSDSMVITEREDYFTANGKRILHYLTAIYELDAEGRITEWREYFDVLDVAKKQGVDPEKIASNQAH